jgi:glucose/arabinose dehydrogenase
MKYSSLILLIILTFSSKLKSQITLDSTILDTHTVITGLDIPWEIVWGPDNFIYSTERSGLVSKIDPNNDSRIVLHDFATQDSSIVSPSEDGLLGMALHPDYLNNGWMYFSYVHSSGYEKVVRYENSGNSLVNKMIIVDSIPVSPIHNGSRILFMADTTLLITTGDAGGLGFPQDDNTKGGKTLRVNDDGTIPIDNPIQGNPMWTKGHRNAQGLVMLPNGSILSSEHGGMDELNIIVPDSNYGWDFFSGNCPQNYPCSLYKDPVFEIGYSIAPSDLVWYASGMIPEFENRVLLTTLREKKIIAIKFDSNFKNVIDTSYYFEDRFGRLRDICLSPDGRVFIATNGEDYSNTAPYTHSIIELRLHEPTGIHSIPASSKIVVKTVDTYQFQINCDTCNFDDASYRLLDAMGRVIESGIFQNNQLVNLSKYDKSVYLLVIQVKSEKYLIKLSNFK